MKFKILVGSLGALALFLAGVFLAMVFSTGILWGEVETRMYTLKSDSLGLAVRCPLVLSAHETGTISTVISNSLNEEVLPVVTAKFSREGVPQETSETLTLAPGASKAMTWHVDASNIIYGRLILVNVSQRNYRDLTARQGYCGILFLNMLGMSGSLILILICAVSLFCMLGGGMLWLWLHKIGRAHV